MNRLFVALSLSLLLSGCLSQGMVPPKAATGGLKEVLIVAMASQPLAIPPSFNPVIVGSGGTVATARGFALVNAITVLFELPEASERSEKISQSYQTVLSQDGAWTPTLILANEAKAQLLAHGLQSTVAPTVKPIPGVSNRSHTAHMENWQAPIREWYNDTKPTADYSDLPRDKSLYILETGMINYQIMEGGELLVQVAMKVIDPSSGTVIGRARVGNAWNMPQLGPLDQVFFGTASRFKDTFRATAQEITKKCLAELNLIQPDRQ